jgi:hypothetical protein
MKLRDLKDFSKDDILDVLGLETKSGTGEWVLGSLGLFGLGVLVGAGVALLLAPKPGSELRQDLTQKIGKLRTQAINNGQTLEGA